MTKVYGENDSRITAKVGVAFEIALPANPTTGYTWRPRADAPQLEVVAQPFDAPAAARPGAGGVQRFIVRPLRPGKTQLQFEYVQPWENAPARTCEFDVNVRLHD